MLLEIKSKVEKNIGFLYLNGVLDFSTVENFKNRLDNVQGVKEVNIDFDKIKFIDSSGVGGILQAIKKFQDDKIAIKINNISNDVFEVFDILGLPELFGDEILEVKQI